jgi:hypothetical protein
LWADRIGGWVSSLFIAGAINRAGPNTAASQNPAVTKRPVFATGITRCDLRFAPKLTDPGYDGLIEQSSLLEVDQQR